MAVMFKKGTKPSRFLPEMVLAHRGHRLTLCQDGSRKDGVSSWWCRSDQSGQADDWWPERELREATLAEDYQPQTTFELVYMWLLEAAHRAHASKVRETFEKPRPDHQRDFESCPNHLCDEMRLSLEGLERFRQLWNAIDRELSKSKLNGESRSVLDIAAEVLQCAISWEQEARLLGNVTARELRRLVVAFADTHPPKDEE